MPYDINLTASNGQLNFKSFLVYIWYLYSVTSVAVVGCDFDYALGPCLCGEIDSARQSDVTRGIRLRPGGS